VEARLVAPLQRLLVTLDAAESELRARRGEELDRIDSGLEHAERVSIIAAALFLLLLGALWIGILRVLLHKQAALDATMAKVVRANEELDAFAGRTAHELRNALTPLALGVRTLEGGRASAADSERIVQRLRRSVDRASATIDALLAFSRAGQPTRGPADVRTSIVDLLDAERPRADALGVRLSGRSDALCIACNQQLVQAVVHNLVANAIKFSAHMENPTVRVDARRDGAWARISVLDTGPGIPEEERSRVLEPFYRAAGACARGSGIGLATVAKIARTHGGRVEVRAGEDGRGTCVEVWLPLANTRPS
jgi:signal transduction histidine kinase